VFIGNVVKCRPPNNRDPQPDEIEACRKHLDAQIGIIAPKVIVTLGRHSMQRYFPGEAISRIHGQPRRTKDQQIIVPMYHPAAALHQGNLRKVIESDRRPGSGARSARRPGCCRQSSRPSARDPRAASERRRPIE
jgi:DNA polymerase